MRASVCSEFLHYLHPDKEQGIGKPPQDVANWLDKTSLPAELLSLLRYDWLQEGAYFGHLYFMSARAIFNDEVRDDFLRQGFLNIGSAPNGDMLVICCDSDRCEVGFITHEEWWEHKDALAEVYQPIARTLDTLLYKLVEGRYLPRDYYSAKGFNTFLAEERAFAQRGVADGHGSG